MLPGPLGSLVLPSPGISWQAQLWGLSVKGAASEEGPPGVAHAQIITAQIPAAGLALLLELLCCSGACFAGHGDLEDDAECRWPLRGTSKLSRSDPTVHQR